MPSPLCHLYIARLLIQRKPTLDTAAFFLGNILPDAVLSRPGHTDADKGYTHLRREHAVWKRDVQDWLADQRPLSPIIMGYGAHLVSDIAVRDCLRNHWNRLKLTPKERESVCLEPYALRVCTQFPEIAGGLMQAQSAVDLPLPRGITRQEALAEISYAQQLMRALPAPLQEDILPYSAFLEMLQEAASESAHILFE